MRERSIVKGYASKSGDFFNFFPFSFFLKKLKKYYCPFTIDLVSVQSGGQGVRLLSLGGGDIIKILHRLMALAIVLCMMCNICTMPIIRAKAALPAIAGAYAVKVIGSTLLLGGAYAYASGDLERASNWIYNDLCDKGSIAIGKLSELAQSAHDNAGKIIKWGQDIWSDISASFDRYIASHKQSSYIAGDIYYLHKNDYDATKDIFDGIWLNKQIPCIARVDINIVDGQHIPDLDNPIYYTMCKCTEHDNCYYIGSSGKYTGAVSSHRQAVGMSVDDIVSKGIHTGDSISVSNNHWFGHHTDALSINLLDCLGNTMILGHGLASNFVDRWGWGPGYYASYPLYEMPHNLVYSQDKAIRLPDVKTDDVTGQTIIVNPPDVIVNVPPIVVPDIPITLPYPDAIPQDKPITTPIPDVQDKPITTPVPDVEELPDAIPVPVPDVIPVPDAVPTPDVTPVPDTSIIDRIKDFFDSPSEFRLNFDAFKGLILPDRFPFCIPFDFVRAVKVYKAPKANYVLSIDIATTNLNVHKSIDMSPYLPYIKFFRSVASLWFAIVLMLRTRDLIKW